MMFDEFIVIKGTTPYTGADFTPPTVPWEIGETVQYPIYIAPPEPEPVPIVSPLDISSSDFCLEVDFKINNLFQWLVYTDGTPNITNQYYGVVGQFDQNEDGSLEDGGNYWVLYIRINADYTIDAIFEVFDNGAIVTQLIHSVIVDWSAQSGITKAAPDDPIHLAVSRYGDLARLFVDGNYSSSGTASGALVDFSTINGDWQLMGPSGQGFTAQPASITNISLFNVYDTPYYWNDYTVIAWAQRTGICLYPRVGIRLIEGELGSMRARLAI